jgi:spermidine synthase
MFPIQRAPSYTTIKELSDPSSPIEYTGVVLAEQASNIQRWTLLLTGDEDEMLFIDDQHQSSKSDEFRYHETFVHSLLCGLKTPKKVLVLGGAEGCMLRELLKWPSVESITQVDWDQSLVTYFKTEGTAWNQGAYKNPKVTYVCEEAMHWLTSNTDVFDAVFVDLLDPHDTDMVFMKKLLLACRSHIGPGGGLSVNAGQVKLEQTTACELATWMKTEFVEPRFHRLAMRVHVPSYKGAWGFLLAVPKFWSHIQTESNLPTGLKYFSKERLVHGSTWDSSYPSELSTFWHPNAAEKLVQDSHELETKVFGHYGC